MAALAPLRTVIQAHGLTARKGLGQHFLMDLNLTRRIARAAGPLSGANVIEIGPGPGGLTRALLLEGAAHVTAVERDARCIAALAPLVDAAAGRLRLVEADALKVDPGELAAAPRLIVANLPYNVASVLLVGWLKRLDAIAGMTLMFQAEVADRLVARPGTKAYGRLSVLTQWLTRAEVVLALPARAFTPPPKVASAVVRFDPHPPDPELRVPAMEAVVAAAFGQRRKMLRQSLKSLGPPPEALLAAADIAPTARADALTVDEFRRLALAWQEIQAGGSAPG
ncbi:MAG: 16S rRNA (adenine(1518)-N(6)/adenine(1519)-N(6))-dimethyltransferase RsmA [Rhodospirillaceae bacterium]|nr:16S rRNA (adenine(1518)-N(6)/adenine(1519)-N(6))-dimethyltransferase RsmA [Rhodospirillaceae bacterium]MCA8932479.1 16S rRNA (adenine(1518)-N(6)/adenine(1519)-N(6))-dimethyltransferase RsmA [Rhodospirillaceae bacterium]